MPTGLPWRMTTTTLNKYNLAENVTEALHSMCRSMICVMEAYTLVSVVLGLPRQKGVIFRVIAGNMKAKTAIGNALKVVEIRDLSRNMTMLRL